GEILRFTPSLLLLHHSYRVQLRRLRRRKMSHRRLRHCGNKLRCAGAGGVPPKDFYDVSLVDGYNVQMGVTTRGGSGDCQNIGCVADLNGRCPNELRVMDGANVVACKSACEAFCKPEYCCTGAFSSSLSGSFYSNRTMSLVANEEFQHILRVLNTNVDGKQKIMFALTSIKGIGRRLANIVCKKADVDMNKRAGELSAAEIDNLMTIVANPKQYKIPDWFLNRQKDYKDGKYSQVVSNALDMKLRDDLERLKKISRNHRGLRHYWGLRVRGQHTKTTGRRGKTVGVSKKR
ncbi:unnamed protein product, partial [Brassica oleracea var. botrytis]